LALRAALTEEIEMTKIEATICIAQTIARVRNQDITEELAAACI